MHWDVSIVRVWLWDSAPPRKLRLLPLRLCSVGMHLLPPRALLGCRARRPAPLGAHRHGRELARARPERELPSTQQRGRSHA